MRVKVFCNGTEQRWAILEQADRAIAVVAEQSADVFELVIVINVECAVPAGVSAWFVGSADRASAALGSEHRGVLLQREDKSLHTPIRKTAVSSYLFAMGGSVSSTGEVRPVAILSAPLCGQLVAATPVAEVAASLTENRSDYATAV